MHSYAVHTDSVWALAATSSFTHVYSGGRDQSVISLLFLNGYYSNVFCKLYLLSIHICKSYATSVVNYYCRDAVNVVNNVSFTNLIYRI